MTGEDGFLIFVVVKNAERREMGGRIVVVGH